MYIGLHKVSEMKALDTDFTEVHFEQIEGSDLREPEVYANEVLESVQTDKPNTDLTDIRNQRVFPIVNNVLAALLKSNALMIDLPYIMDRVKMSLQDTEERAIVKRIGVKKEKLTLLHLEQILSN